MLARILPLFALLVLCVLAYWLYTQGTIQQILRPTVSVVETQRPLIEGQKIRKNFVGIKEVPISNLAPGLITFAPGASVDDVVEALAGQTIARNIKKGEFLRASMLGDRAEFVVLRLREDLVEGEKLSLRNVEASVLDHAPPGGAIIFESQEAASVYVNDAYDMSVRGDLERGHILTISDASGGAERLYVIRASRDFSRSEYLDGGGLETAEISGKDLSSGAITFQTRGAADVFITASGKYILAESVDQGQIITADMVSGATDSGGVLTRPDDLPRTLSELTSYMLAYPDRTMMIEPSTYIGSRDVQPGEKVDIWVEDSRTSGAFGKISLKRLSEGTLVRIAEDTSDTGDVKTRASRLNNNARAAIGEPTVETPSEDVEEVAREFLWVVTDPEVRQRFNTARRTGRIAFAVRDSEELIDILGSGTTCSLGACQVNRQASDDLSEVVLAMATQGASADGGGGLTQDPLAVMDGVSLNLEDLMRRNGYDSFRVVSLWPDSDIPAISIKLGITNNLAFYIREQARILNNSAAAAAQELGLDEAPAN